MNLFERIKNVWDLSGYKTVKNTGDLVVENEPTLVLVKKQAGRFIPRVTVTPVEELVNEPIHE
jgi:hypothetical protein